MTGKQPSAAARRRVAEAFDADKLAHLCETWDFTPYAERYDLTPHPNGDERFYWHRDNGSKILAVAHLDTVQDDRRCNVVDTASGLLAVSGALDDRLGAYVILELLPRLGMTFDILLTTDEERGRSTADEFETDKDYDWIIEFDRGGTDVVMYDYETPDLVDLVEACGARVGVGIFSDICELDFLGCAAFNWGVGYEDYHSPRSHAWLDNTFRMVARFEKFHRANAGTRLAHTPPPRREWWETYRDADAEYDAAIREFDEDHLMVADCGDMVDLDDPASYVTDGSYVECLSCATAGAWAEEPA